jgi:hypothetical protein
VRLPAARVVREPAGGWLVIRGSHGWLFGDRQAALAEKAWLDQQWRGRR